MGRRVSRVTFDLDTGDVETIPEDEIRAILRAADDIISSGGRALLGKILKGSRDKTILEHELDKSPMYGYYKDLTLEQIGHRVDWMIKNKYFRIEYDGRLPLLVYSFTGWEIEKQTYIDELFEQFYQDVKDHTATVVPRLKDTHRDIAIGIIEKIALTKDKNLIPLLEYWRSGEVKKVRALITEAIHEIRTAKTDP